RRLLRHLAAAGSTVRPTDERVLAHVTDTVTPQGIVAVVAVEDGGRRTADGGEAGLPSAVCRPPSAPLVLVLDGIGDPGNTGTLLRSAAGAEASAVIAVRGTTDLYGPKVVRAAAGAHFSLRLATGLGWD